MSILALTPGVESITVLVRCDSVSCRLGRGAAAVTAVREATCTVRVGDRIAVSGRSGSGKSTLLSVLAGLEAPTGGSVSWPALGGREALRPRHVGMAFQGPSLIAALDVAENVALPLLLGGAGEDAARDAAVAALDELGLGDLAARLPEELSGGQAQRVAIARVLAAAPSLILADEPTGQLDTGAAAAVLDALEGAARSTGAALVVTTHDERVAARFTQRWRMSDGVLDTGEGW